MNQDPTQLAAYFEGAEFPATGGELAGVAAGNDAPSQLIETLRQFEGKHFDDINAAIKALSQQQ